MGVPLLSATQISLWGECKRKWGFRYLDHIKPPQTKGAALGQEVQDTQIDPWLATGRPFDFSRPSGEIALELSKLLPAPKTPGLVLRRKFVLPSPTAQWGYQGELDLWAPDSRIVPGLENPLDELIVPLVADTKTTSNLNFAKSDSDLLTDNQSMIYSMLSLFEDSTDVVDLVWFTARTRKPYRAQRTGRVRVRAPHVVEQFERIETIGKEVVGIVHARPKTQELEPNPRMCEQYGGCPYRQICNLSPAAFASAWNQESPKMNSGTVDFLAGLRKGAPAPAAALTPAAPVAATAPAVPAAFAPGGAFAGTTPPSGQIAPGGNPHPAAGTPALPSWMTAPQDPLKHALGHADPRTGVPAAPPAPAAAAVPINPPESALPPAPPVGAAALAPAAPAAPRGPGRPRKSAEPAPAAASSAPSSGASGFKFDPELLDAVSNAMRQRGIKKLAFDGENVCEIELA